MNHHSYIETMMCMRDGAIGANLQVEVIGRGRVVVPGTGGTVLTAAEIVFRAGLEIVTISSCFVTNINLVLVSTNLILINVGWYFKRD
jgi:hypothetical protein